MQNNKLKNREIKTDDQITDIYYFGNRFDYIKHDNYYDGTNFILEGKIRRINSRFNGIKLLILFNDR